MVAGLRCATSNNLLFEVLHMWAKGQWRRAAQTSTRSAAARSGTAVCNGCSGQSQVENEYHACKRSHPRFLLFGRVSCHSFSIQVGVLMKGEKKLGQFPACELHREMHSGCSSTSRLHFVDGQNGKRCRENRQRHHEPALMFGSRHCENRDANSSNVVAVDLISADANQWLCRNEPDFYFCGVVKKNGALAGPTIRAS